MRRFVADMSVTFADMNMRGMDTGDYWLYTIGLGLVIALVALAG
jgi:hypothetical protein